MGIGVGRVASSASSASMMSPTLKCGVPRPRLRIVRTSRASTGIALHAAISWSTSLPCVARRTSHAGSLTLTRSRMRRTSMPFRPVVVDVQSKVTGLPLPGRASQRSSARASTGSTRPRWSSTRSSSGLLTTVSHAPTKRRSWDSSGNAGPAGPPADSVGSAGFPSGGIGEVIDWPIDGKVSKLVPVLLDQCGIVY